MRLQPARGREPPTAKPAGRTNTLTIDVDRAACLLRAPRQRERTAEGVRQLGCVEGVVDGDDLARRAWAGSCPTPCGAHRAQGTVAGGASRSTTERTSRRRRTVLLGCAWQVAGRSRRRSGARSTRSSPAARERAERASGRSGHGPSVTRRPRSPAWEVPARRASSAGGQPRPHPRRPEEVCGPACRGCISDRRYQGGTGPSGSLTRRQVCDHAAMEFGLFIGGWVPDYLDGRNDALEHERLDQRDPHRRGRRPRQLEVRVGHRAPLPRGVLATSRPTRW